MRRIVYIITALLAISLPAEGEAQMTGFGFAMLNTNFTAAGDGTEAEGSTIKLIGRLGVTSITKMTGGGFLLAPGVIASQRTAQADVTEIHAYPVPFVPSQGHTEIVFTRLPTRATIEIFTLAGELVKRLEHDASGTDRLSWYPVANENGNPVASGVYMWVATDHDKKSKIGKLAIIK